MLKPFVQFLLRILGELGVDADTIIKAFAEESGFKGLKQERDLRAQLQELGIGATPGVGQMPLGPVTVKTPAVTEPKE